MHTMDLSADRPADGYVRIEFHLVVVVLAAAAWRHAHQKILICLHIPMHLAAIMLLLYGRIEQKETSKSDTWFNHVDQEVQLTVFTASEKQTAYDFLHFSLVTWIASVLFDIRIIQFIQCDIVSQSHDIQRIIQPNQHGLVSRVLVLNAMIMMSLISMMEYFFVTSITSEWWVLLYMVSSTITRLLQTYHQGNMYLNGSIRAVYTSTECLSLFLTVLANIVIPIANILSIRVYVNGFPPHAYQIIVVCLIPMVIIDIIYHLALFNWYCNGVRLLYTPVQETTTGNTEIPTYFQRNDNKMISENTNVEAKHNDLINF